MLIRQTKAETSEETCPTIQKFDRHRITIILAIICRFTIQAQCAVRQEIGQIYAYERYAALETLDACLQHR